MQFFPVLPQQQTSIAQIKGSKGTTSSDSFGGLLARLGNMETTDKASSSISNARTILLNNSDFKGATIREKLLKGQTTGETNSEADTTLIDVPTLNALKTKLRKIGVDDTTLDKLDEEADQGTLTWNGLLSTLSEDAAFSGKEAAAITLDDKTRNETDLFLQKLGFTPEESGDLIETMEQGDISKAWKSVMDKIGSLPEGSSVAVSTDELASLGKAMRLGEDGIKRMQELMAGQTEGQADAKGLKALLAEISNNVTTLKTETEERFSELKKALAPAMEEAWERSGSLSASSARVSKDTEASAVLMKDSATAEANGFSSKTAASSGHKDVPRETRTDNAVDAQKHGQPEQAKHEQVSDQQHASDDAMAQEQDSKDTSSALAGKHGTDSKKHQSAFGDADTAKKDSDTSTSSSNDEKAKALLERLGYQVANSGAASTTGQIDGSAAKTAAGNLVRSSDQQRIFEQVESGMMKSLENGGKQLTLQLTPEDLGKVTVVLSVRNHEVNAIIRPESAEAAKAINDQLHQLKASLENQGLKVDNIDVQTGLQNNMNDSNNWQGSAEHNAQQELRQKFLNQRRLQGIRSGETTLAQEMQNTGETANSSIRTGLDLIA